MTSSTTSTDRTQQDGPAAQDAGPAAQSGGCGNCGCGAGGCGGGGVDAPVLDLRMIPGPFRNGALLGVLATLPPGEAAGLIASEDPVPLLFQVEENEPGAFSVAVEESGPDLWVMELRRVG